MRNAVLERSADDEKVAYDLEICVRLLPFLLELRRGVCYRALMDSDSLFNPKAGQLTRTITDMPHINRRIFSTLKQGGRRDLVGTIKDIR